MEVNSCTHAHLKTHDTKPQIVDSEALICEQLGDVILPRLIGLFLMMFNGKCSKYIDKSFMEM